MLEINFRGLQGNDDHLFTSGDMYGVSFRHEAPTFFLLIEMSAWWSLAPPYINHIRRRKIQEFLHKNSLFRVNSGGCNRRASSSVCDDQRIHPISQCKLGCKSHARRAQ
mmetsp:Transcript_11072/g.22678  ORF Transcript_11072/g.22678 Transcript_11072/m.22678 type:complete len:109 (-) Transcript_11072:780-1106(-)